MASSFEVNGFLLADWHFEELGVAFFFTTVLSCVQAIDYTCRT